MNLLKGLKRSLFVLILSIFSINGLFAASTTSHAQIAPQIFEKVKQNNNWKIAFLTAKNAQIVFMNISPLTNPNNEIGMETHKFDQIIFVVEGKGKAILEDKITMVKPGDVVFIPQGIKHNVVNSNSKNPLKILSVYSSRDIPAGASYPKKSDEPQE